MKPAPDDIISEMNVSAPKASVTKLLAPSTKGTPTTAKVVKSTASRYRTFGSVTGLLSPHGERVKGILTVDVTVATLERATRPTRVSPRNRLVLLDLRSSLAGFGALVGSGALTGTNGGGGGMKPELIPGLDW